MRRVAAEFATPSRPGRWHWLAVSVLALLSIGLAARAVLGHFELLKIEADIRSLQAQLAAAAQRPVSAPTPPYDASAREMLRERDPLWAETLTALESVDVKGVVVMAINMPGPSNPITIQLAVTDYPTMLEYLESLNGPTLEPGALHFELQQARSEASSGRLSVTLMAFRVLPANH